ncbi:uncharacterized protein LOC131158739 [Malania oleifera]|uniref:uncharacterized protein LOC131158739 n=1 Tax=Malania oleifera TaxID=397392 RepID=UPI0025AE697B|nr:uncharacterized protein LOC131158739 [Malania oleifera]
MMNSKFRRWNQVNNFEHHRAGRIIVLWNSQKVKLQVLAINAQVIHCYVVCPITSNKFALSFVYGFNSIVARRTLWQDLTQFSLSSEPWLLMGDFNYVYSTEGKKNGNPVTDYESKDINEYFSDVGLSDLNSSSCFLMWNNRKVWCKLDGVVVNVNWLLSNRNAHAIFLLLGLLLDHSDCIVSLFDENDAGKKPFKFFNMWANHLDFQKVLAKSKYLKDSDNSSSFFHYLMRRHTSRNHISSVKRSNGVLTTSYQRVVDEFLSFYKGLLGTESSSCSVDPSVIAKGKDYRPIAYCNVMYKVITKIIAGRVKPYLKKAYDSISWKFLKEMLDNLNFPTRVVNWIMQCVSTGTYSLSINGGIHGFFEGLSTNTLKSNILCAGIKDLELEEIKEMTEFQNGEFPFRYLGIPLVASRLNKMHYDPLIDRISSLLNGWPSHTISYAGRLELINSVIQGVECVWLAIFPIPKAVVDHIVRLCKTFLWCGRRKPIVVWREVCLSKNEGGLGVFNLMTWNKALLTKALFTQCILEVLRCTRTSESHFGGAL